MNRLFLGALMTAASACVGQSGGAVDADPCFEPECRPGTPAEQKAECDDGDPRTVDRCVLISSAGGACAHVPAGCDALDSAAVGAAACAEGTGCDAWRCRGDNTCVAAESCKPPDCHCETTEELFSLCKASGYFTATFAFPDDCAYTYRLIAPAICDAACLAAKSCQVFQTAQGKIRCCT